MFFERLKRQLGSVGVRIWTGYALLLLVSLSALFGLADWQLRLALMDRDRTAIHRELDELARDYGNEGIKALREELSENAVTPGRKRLYVRLADSTGQTAWGMDWPGDALNHLAWAGLPNVASWTTLRVTDDLMLEIAAQRLPDKMYLQVGATTEGRREVLATFRRTFVLATLSVLLLGLLGGLFVARRVLRPLKDLTVVARNIEATGKLSDRVPVRGTNDDLDQLAIRFNEMLARIQRLVEGMRTTLDDVAHDLRTPMTRLRGHVELALQRGAASEAPSGEALVEAIESCDQILAILDAIMEQAEAETGALPLQLEDTSLASVVAEVVDLYQLAGEEKQLVITAHADDDVVVPVDVRRIRQAVANLVDNAIKFTPAGGRIDVTVAREETEAVIRVADTGVGIPAADLPLVWDRLFRGDRSRSTRGLGLGLSLVRAKIEAHGGCVEVESRPNLGSVFTLRLRTA